MVLRIRKKTVSKPSLRGSDGLQGPVSCSVLPGDDCISEMERGSQWFSNLNLHLGSTCICLEGLLKQITAPCLMASEICISNTTMPRLPVLGPRLENHWWTRPVSKRQQSINGCKSLTKLLLPMEFKMSLYIIQEKFAWVRSVFVLFCLKLYPQERCTCVRDDWDQGDSK